MKIVRAYRLGDDGYSVYQLPKPRELVSQMKDTWGSVYSMIERRTLEGGIPKPIQRLETQQEA